MKVAGMSDHQENLPSWWVVRGTIVLLSLIIGGMFTSMLVLVYGGFVVADGSSPHYELVDYLSHNAPALLIGLLFTIGLAVWLEVKHGETFRRNL
jgi:hypothetical protein